MTAQQLEAAAVPGVRHSVLEDVFGLVTGTFVASLGIYLLKSAHAVTGGGAPSFYFEEHQAVSMSLHAMVTSFILEGVPERLPNLKIVVVEGGFAWWPALAWRMDKHWKRLKAEVPSLRRAPSEYLREHFWVTTQPIEEPERPQDMLALIEQIGSDRIMFSTDYPHWDQDDPRYAFKVQLPDDWARAIYRDNAKALYHLP